MTSENNLSMAVFCDFENVALGVRDAEYDSFDIKPVLERLLLKGSIVVKKAYCNWDRYKPFKAAMHEANFELIEIPHVRQSGKNSADIRLVVDALDLCYTKTHVNTFVIISGDSDFSPLVSKLRENAKKVIGVGVKQSTSDLLVANCDEFIFYDDLVRERQRNDARRGNRGQGATKRAPAEDKRASSADDKRSEDKRRNKDDVEVRRTRAIEIAVETFDAMMSERGDSGKLWASVLKEAIKRRMPDFNESYFGFRTFGNVLEEAQSRGLLAFGRDDKSGAYVYRHAGEDPAAEAHPVAVLAQAASDVTQAEALDAPGQDESIAGELPARSPRKRQNARARKKAQHASHGQGELPTAVDSSDASGASWSEATDEARTDAAHADATHSSAHQFEAERPDAEIVTAAETRTSSPPVKRPSGKSAQALPPIATATGTILPASAHTAESHKDAEDQAIEVAPKRRSRKPRSATATTAPAPQAGAANSVTQTVSAQSADTVGTLDASPSTTTAAAPAARPRRARKTAKSAKADS